MALPPVTATLRLLRRRRQRAFSVVELLVGILISTLVLTAAVRALLALVQGDRDSQVELNRKDDMGRVLGLMQDEIRNAQRVESGGSLTTLSGCSTTPLLILRGSTSAQDLSYGLQASSNSSWRGPNVLVRCGLPYDNNAALDTTASRSEQVILDTLAATGFSASTLGGTGTISRNVQLTLISSASGGSITNSLQVPINTNQVYGLITSGATACPDGTGSISTGCADPNGEAMHYKPTLGGTDINGSPSMEDIFYFDGKRSDYSLNRTPGSGNCTNDQCTVRQGTTGSSITFFDGDVLVFKDLQIRL